MRPLTLLAVATLLGSSRLVLAGPVMASVTVTWEVPAAKRFHDTTFLTALSYRARIQGGLDSFFIPDPSAILDAKGKTLASVPFPRKASDPIPAMDKVRLDPLTYETKDAYAFAFASPIPDATAALRFGGGYFSSDAKTTIGVFDVGIRYEAPQGDPSATLAPKATQVAFTTFRLASPADQDPDVVFSLDNPTDETLLLQGLQLRVSDAALDNDVAIASAPGFASLPPGCTSSQVLAPGSGSTDCTLRGLLPGQFLYVRGTSSGTGGPPSAFLYGYRIQPVAEPGSLALVAAALALLAAASARPRPAHR